MAGCETRREYVDEDSTSLHIYHVLQKDIIILFTKVKIKKGLYEKTKHEHIKNVIYKNSNVWLFYSWCFS